MDEEKIEREEEKEEKREEKEEEEKVEKEEEKTEDSHNKFENKDEKPQESFTKEGSLTNKLRKNPFILSTLVCGTLAVLLLIIMVSGGGMTGKVVSEEHIGSLALDFANNELFSSPGEIISVEEISGMYKILFSINSEEVPLYFTKDGKWISQGGELIPITEQISFDSESSDSRESQDIPKSDKPEVELFIMTHCPYGTQAEKGMIPVIEALGDKADIQIRFVHYFMHEPEETETPRQVCIREEQSKEWLTYLRCFLEDGDADRCLIEVGINQDELSDCVDNRAEAYYVEDSELSEDYGVQGSPSLVINGEIISSSRSPAAYLDTICAAFNDAPSECELELSTLNPSPMWGWDASGDSTTAQC